MPEGGVTESGRVAGAGCCLTLSAAVPDAAPLVDVLPIGDELRRLPAAALSARAVTESIGTMPVTCRLLTSEYAGRIDGQKS